LAIAGTPAIGAVFTYELNIEASSGSPAYSTNNVGAPSLIEGGTVNIIRDNAGYGKGGLSTTPSASQTTTWSFGDTNNAISFGFDLTLTGVGNTVDAFGNGFAPPGNFDPGQAIEINVANLSFQSPNFTLNSIKVFLNTIDPNNAPATYDIEIDTDGNLGNGPEVVGTKADDPHVFAGVEPALNPVRVTCPASSTAGNNYRVSNLQFTIELDLNGPVTFSTTPADDFIVQADYPATLVTNSVAATYTEGLLSTNVQITALNISNDPSNAFSVVTGLPFSLPNPAPSNSPLEIAFDATAVTNVVFDNATEGFNYTSVVDVVWTEIGSGTSSTNALTLLGRYRNPQVDLNIDNSLSMSLIAPATAVTNNLTVSYDQGRPGHTNVQITAINIVDASTNGFSSITAPFTMTDPAPSNTSISIEFDNSGGQLTHGMSATANVEVVWSELGGTTNYTEIIPASVSYTDLPKGVVQVSFANAVNNLKPSSTIELNDFGAYTNSWLWNNNMNFSTANGYVSIKSASNTRALINLVESGTAGMDNFGAADTEILTNGLYRYDFVYEVVGTTNSGTFWSIDAYSLINQGPTGSVDFISHKTGDGPTSIGTKLLPTASGLASFQQHSGGILTGAGDVAKTTGSVTVNVTNGNDAVFVLQRSNTTEIRLYEVVLTRIGDYEPIVPPTTPADAVLDARFADPATSNSLAATFDYDYNDTNVNIWAYGAGGAWNGGKLELKSGALNSRSMAVVTRAGTAGYDDVGSQDTIALTSGTYTVSMDVTFKKPGSHPEGAGSVTVFSFGGLDATGNVNDVRLDLGEGTNALGQLTLADIEAALVPKLRGTAFFTELAKQTITTDLPQGSSVVFTGLSVQDGEDLCLRFNCYSNADFNVIDNIQVVRTGDAAPVGYNAWAASFALAGNDALLTADVEPDGLNNLMEYALGGDPTIDDAATVAPSHSFAMDAGTNWMYHVYNERTDDPRLIYELGRKLDLIFSANWTTGAIEFVGESADIGGFKSVTNRAPAEAGKAFLRLNVEKLP